VRDVDPAPLPELEATLDQTFSDLDLVRRAMSHRSWCAENGEPESNERLEFLGDSVLGVIVTDYVFTHFPELGEGNLSEVRAGVVNAETLAEVAGEISLGRYLLLGKGEAGAGGRTKQSILADALEALIAAIYLDQGLSVARGHVLGWLAPRIAEAASGPGGRDSKTRLQELAAQRGLGRPRYDVRGEGPDHAKRFYATVYVGETVSGRGEGRSKKQAEQEAAWVAQRSLTAERDEDAGSA